MRGVPDSSSATFAADGDEAVAILMRRPGLQVEDGPEPNMQVWQLLFWSLAVTMTSVLAARP